MSEYLEKKLTLGLLIVIGILSVFADISSPTKEDHNEPYVYTNTSTSNFVLSSQGIPAFPGAEGFGAVTVGGRGGQIIKVTNLNDSGAGSFRAAVQASGARIIVFDIGGVITLNSDIVVSNPYITIAGQTAPGNGIVIKRGALDIQTHDVIVRGIKSRVGDEAGGVTSTVRRGISMGPPWSNPSSAAVYNVIVDHSSISWGVDTNLNMWTDSAGHSNVVHDVTFQWNIVSEALYDSIHIDEGASTPAPHSMGATFGKNTSNITVHHNLFAHNDDRNPRLAGIINGEMINNLIYDWGSGPTRFSDDKSIIHIINNYYKAGGDSRQAEVVFGSQTTYDPNTGVNTYIHPESLFYLSGNLTNDPRNGNPVPMDARTQYEEGRFIAGGSLFSSSGVLTHSAAQAHDLVLNYAGATSPVRDSIDQRVVSDVVNRSGSIINSQNDVGGWSIYTPTSRPTDFDQDNDGIADSWETTYGLNYLSNDANGDLDGDGYTNIEEYINSLIVMAYGSQTPPMPIAGGGNGGGSSSGGDTGGGSGGTSNVGGEGGTGDENPTESGTTQNGDQIDGNENSTNNGDSTTDNPSSGSTDLTCTMVALSGSINRVDPKTPPTLNGLIIIAERVDSIGIVSTKSDSNGNWNFSLCAGTYSITLDERVLPPEIILKEEKTVTLIENQPVTLQLNLTKEAKIQQIVDDVTTTVKPHLNKIGLAMLTLSIGGYALARKFN